MLEAFISQFGRMSVKADGIDKDLSLSEEDIYLTLMPLREWVLELRKASGGDRRVMVGIAGPGGAGKTTLAKMLAAALNDGAEGARCAVLGMDGYHHKNSTLEAMSYCDPISGDQEPLRRVKGRPETFDAAKFVADIQRVRDASANGSEVLLPEYDRVLHEPVDGRVTVDPEVDIVLVEGLFLLLEQGHWAKVSPLLDGAVLVTMPAEACKQRLRTRQLAAGRNPEDFEAHYARVDGPNYDDIMEQGGRSRADAVLWLPPEGGLELQLEPNSNGSTLQSRPPSLLLLGLNPALQKAMWFASLQKGEVNRAEKVTYSVGGKGQGAARAAGACCRGVCTLAHFLGGGSGEFVAAQLEEAGIPQVTEIVGGETRTATTLLCAESGTATEIIDPSAPIPPENVQQLLQKTVAAAADATAIGLCGTFPPGVGPEFYAAVASAKVPGTILLLDGYKGIAPALETKQVDILKINADELLELTGESSTAAAARLCLDKGFAKHVAITDGPRPAQLYSFDGAWEVEMPTIEVVNPIGAGDTCAGVMLYHLTRGDGVLAAFQWGLAAACASCLHEQGAVFDPADVNALHDRMCARERCDV